MPLIFRERILLAPLTTFGVGGLARYFTETRSEDELAQALAFADERKLPVFILGGGSNILVSDEGFPGLVVHMGIQGFEIDPSTPHQTSLGSDGAGQARLGNTTSAIVTAGAGENWDDVVQRCVAEGLAGIECLSGIPGSVGAAPVQNIGAYGQQISSIVRVVRVFDRETQTSRELGNFDCQFSYRDSVFKREGAGRYVITKVSMELVYGTVSTPTYHDVVRYFSERGIAAPTLEQVRHAVVEIRSRKGFVLLPGYERLQSAGSFFKNPVVAEKNFERVREAVQGERGASICQDPWSWRTSRGSVKISAACLIQCAGFVKGCREGNAGISTKHPLALINCGGARASEIAALARKIRSRVYEKFGVMIEPEVQAVGFPEDPFAVLTAAP